MKKHSVLLSAVLLALCMQSAALAADNADDVSVIVNGEEIVFGEDQPPVIENGRTLVPFRAVLEKMGAKVEWDNDSQRVTCTLADKQVTLVIGSDKMSTSSGEVALDVPAKIIGSRTMVPIRAISEGLGAQVDWDGENRVVTVTGNAAEVHEGYSFKSIDSKITSNGNTLLTITAKYPVLEGSSDAVTAINNALEADANARVKQCEQIYGADATELEAGIKLMLEEDIPPTSITVNDDGTFYSDWGCDINYEVKTLDEAVMSAYVTELSYLGGAHPTTVARGVTYNMQTGEKMKAEDFVEDALNKGKAGIREMAAADPEAYPFYDEETFAFTDDDFYIEGAQLVFVVQQYEIAPYAAGIIEYRIDLEGI